MRGEKLRTENRRKAGHEFFLSKFHIELKGQVFDRNQWNLWTFASLGIFSLHVPCTSMAWKSDALPYDFQMRYRSTGHLTTYDIFRYFYRFPDRMRPCDIGGCKIRLTRGGDCAIDHWQSGFWPSVFFSSIETGKSSIETATRVARSSIETAQSPLKYSLITTGDS